MVRRLFDFNCQACLSEAALASYHCNSNVEKIIAAAECYVKYLPAYSPDFNPIEHCWFLIKNYARHLAATTLKTIKKCLTMSFNKFCLAK